jgi:uncharacterized protein YodC (DUF2158 family)
MSIGVLTHEHVEIKHGVEKQWRKRGGTDEVCDRSRRGTTSCDWYDRQHLLRAVETGCFDDAHLGVVDRECINADVCNNCSGVFIVWLIGCKLIGSLCLSFLVTQNLGFLLIVIID